MSAQPPLTVQLASAVSENNPDRLPFDLADLVENVDYALNIIDGDGNMLYANRHALETEIVPRAFIGRNMYDLRRSGVVISPAAIQTIEEKRVVIKEVEHYNGRLFVAVTAPVFDAAGKVRYVIAMTSDIMDLYDIVRSLTGRVSSFDAYSERVHIGHADVQEPVDMVANSPEMLKLVEMVNKIAPTSASALILGDSGVGKEVLARLIHQKSRRADKPMLAINCGSIPPSLMEAELFGYEKGAFTGADKSQPGLFELANNGTLLLDELGELDLLLQVKFLRVLQSGVIRRIGGKRDIPVDVRIIAATNRDIQQMVKDGRFRLDLFYRLNVIKFVIPPLHKRPKDILALIPALLKKHNERNGTAKYLPQKLWHILMDYTWPGNIRELDNVIERLVLLSPEDVLSEEYLPDSIMQNAADIKSSHPAPAINIHQSLRSSVEAFEKQLLTEARQAYGTCRNMAEALQMDYSTIAKKMRRYGIK